MHGAISRFPDENREFEPRVFFFFFSFSLLFSIFIICDE